MYSKKGAFQRPPKVQKKIQTGGAIVIIITVQRLKIGYSIAVPRGVLSNQPAAALTTT